MLINRSEGFYHWHL